METELSWVSTATGQTHGIPQAKRVKRKNVLEINNLPSSHKTKRSKTINIPRLNKSKAQMNLTKKIKQLECCIFVDQEDSKCKMEGNMFGAAYLFPLTIVTHFLAVVDR